MEEWGDERLGLSNVQGAEEARVVQGISYNAKFSSKHRNTCCSVKHPLQLMQNSTNIELQSMGYSSFGFGRRGGEGYWIFLTAARGGRLVGFSTSSDEVSFTGRSDQFWSTIDLLQNLQLGFSCFSPTARWGGYQDFIPTVC